METKKVNSKLLKFWKWLKWRRFCGVVLIVAGFFLIYPFIKPYIYLVTAKAPVVVSNSKEDVIRTAHGRILKSHGKIFIPRLKMAENILEGVNRTNLDYGISHYRNSSWPGMKGNIVLSGHNFYGQSPLFSLLDWIKVKDKVIIHYQGKRYTYKVTNKIIINPNKLSEYETTKEDRLTLITCWPRGYTAKRLVVIAKETGENT